ncbi:MAG: hypothetical protein COW18_03190 [Zetaproteobacteria bacterium CG12_big_fil_rev_8_21_14_0_65_54_13]|nr:MAG: hypothetical protein COX55_08640 [Zetaproteobacteria bacterium CG23_combo_of_CG06-09_8_20_14_all_54_7]PIW50695.1 MAG: hypothetical protein COW18_03190 [Zetaproteobacteria bacterium CG12_big_fil_rev_8_21_14_0_65_54_13]PIX55576.1 MAG: hypothetical protein COZ50_01900 [Zetaproteobacteria bacterium CG_4_10_14_3_um_filter_54_28]PJA27448.1 MAG: hypothetical protein CO188_12305 [Zetaproteobacteria bacterium CG_4_9_14_3_um_filter_54_145]
MFFFPKLAAFNISWHENPDKEKAIQTYVANPHTGGNKKALTRTGIENFTGSHEGFYREYIKGLRY